MCVSNWVQIGRDILGWVLRDEYLDSMHLGFYKRHGPRDIFVHDTRRTLALESLSTHIYDLRHLISSDTQ